MKNKILIGLSLFGLIILAGGCKSHTPHRETRKPVVYIYPAKKQLVNVKLNYNGTLRATYPLYKNNWEFIADVDGKLTDPITGDEYQYLFYDGISSAKFSSFTQGFSIKTDTVISFLQHKLKFLGLNAKEYNDMISYWLPDLNEKTFCQIRFRMNGDCDAISTLSISPKPDTEIRVMMEFVSSDNYTKLPAQKLEKNYRNGFTIVEWGGVNLTNDPAF